jgi:hypothetical protein
LIDSGHVEQLRKMHELSPSAGASSETSPASESDNSLREVLVSIGVKPSRLVEAEKKAASMLLYTSKKAGGNIDVALRMAVEEHWRGIQDLSESNSITGEIKKPILLLLHALVVRRFAIFKAVQGGVTDVGVSKISAADREALNEEATKAIQAVSSLGTAQVRAALILEAGKLESVRMQCTWRA